MPKAENTAAIFGISTLCTPVSCAAPHALIGPAPPNAAMVVSRGSSMAGANDSAIRSKYADSILTRASSTLMPSGSATAVRIAVFDRSASSENPPSR